MTLTGFVGMLALVLLGLLPIEWLFSVSTRSLAFVVWLHLMLWTLFCVVSFQVTTFMRPTLWREPNAPAFEHGKLFFLDHLSQALR